MKTNLKVRSANLARVLIDGDEVGLMQNVNMSDDYAPNPASGIGDIHAIEYVPSMARHSISCSKMALRTAGLYAKGIIPKNGEDALKGLVIDIEVLDKATGTVIRKYIDCTYASGSTEVTKHAIISYQSQWMGLDVDGGM
ncbi:MAG: hypothetical protein WC343_07525 [Bacilli bacterium]|jgi:hypothetical protein